MNEKLKFFLAGFFIGIAELLPGISGSTVAVAFRIYNKIIKILSNIRIKNISGNFADISFKFRLDLLLLLVSSMAVTVIFFSKIVLYFYTNYNDLFEIFLAINNPILSAKISLPLLSITPTLSPAPSKPNPTSALFVFTHFAIS